MADGGARFVQGVELRSNLIRRRVAKVFGTELWIFMHQGTPLLIRYTVVQVVCTKHLEELLQLDPTLGGA